MSYAVDDADRASARDEREWTVTQVKATLPNCDGCGRFTSKPERVSWCTGGNAMGAHVCHELLLCPKCYARRGPE